MFIFAFTKHLSGVNNLKNSQCGKYDQQDWIYISFVCKLSNFLPSTYLWKKIWGLTHFSLSWMYFFKSLWQDLLWLWDKKDLKGNSGIPLSSMSLTINQIMIVPGITFFSVLHSFCVMKVPIGLPINKTKKRINFILRQKNLTINCFFPLFFIGKSNRLLCLAREKLHIESGFFVGVWPCRSAVVFSSKWTWKSEHGV